MFVDAILTFAETFERAQNIDLTKGDVEMGAGEGASGSGSGSGPTEVEPTKAGKEIRMQGLENRLINLEHEILERRMVDNLMMARVREELDLVANNKKEDRIVITGLTSGTPVPDNYEEKKKWLRNIVDGLLNRIVPGTSEKIVFFNQGRSRGREIPMVEVRVDSRETAFKIRNTFVVKKKEGRILAESTLQIVSVLRQE